MSLDNASNNDVLAGVIPDYLMINSVRPYSIESFFMCVAGAHILNLIVHDGLNLLNGSIEKITDIVRSMNSSNKRHELWIQCCLDLDVRKRNIDNDVPHRWNSTYDLLKVAIKYKLVLNRYVTKLNQSSRSAILSRTWLVKKIG